VSKQEELKAQYIMQNKSPEIIEKAVEPLYPSKPKRRSTLMVGAVLGVFLGLGTALFREYMDNSVHTAEDAARSVDLSVLSTIPRLRDIKKNPGMDALITYHDTNSSRNERAREFYKESYRMLQLEVMSAANIQHSASSIQHDGGLALLVTSSVSDEGRSIVAANLAICIAQTGRKVLLVDADCRSSVQHKLLDLDAQMGLVDVLAGNAAWSDVVKNTFIDNLYAITSGVEHAFSLSDRESRERDPSALLISPRLEDFTKLSKEQFDFIIFDSPSAILASESAAIGSKVDGVVLVIRANDTKKDIILQAKQRIQNSGGNILGAVLNYV
jgi:succinoglycan biosynthesis transport protein ExoP